MSFGQCIYPYNHCRDQDGEHFGYPKSSLCFPTVNPAPPTGLFYWPYWVCFSCSRSSFKWTHAIRRWLLGLEHFLGIGFLGFMHVALTGRSFVLLSRIPEFTCWGTSGVRQFSTNLNTAAMHICVQVFVGCAFVFHLGTYLRGGFLGLPL